MRGSFAATVVFALMGTAALIRVRPDAKTTEQEKTESRQYSAQYVNNYLQNYRYPPYAQYGNGGQQKGIMDILETISAQDELHCIPKLLCEMTSSGMRPNQGSSTFNLDSLLSLLAGVDDRLASPVVQFGRALVLGYTSKHSSSCKYAYPRCPSDPDRLIHYLNNHKGGLFRLFNSQASSSPGTPASTNSFHIYENGDKRQYAWRFPSYDSQIHNYENDGWLPHHGKGKSLKFPSNEEGYNHEHEHEYDYDTQHNDVLVFRDFK